MKKSLYIMVGMMSFGYAYWLSGYNVMAYIVAGMIWLVGAAYSERFEPLYWGALVVMALGVGFNYPLLVLFMANILVGSEKLAVRDHKLDMMIVGSFALLSVLIVVLPVRYTAFLFYDYGFTGRGVMMAFTLMMYGPLFCGMTLQRLALMVRRMA